MKHWLFLAWLFSNLVMAVGARAESAGEAALAEYFKAETKALSDACLSGIKSLKDWEKRKPVYRQQLFEMLGLHPLPEKSELKPTITGRIEKEDFTVEKLHFQSLPGLYVTANLYLPKGISKPAPTILYLSGHAKVITNGVSFGNKTAYQHHGIWFARNGYACLTVDTLQLGEVQGLHHGTHNLGMWWWNSRGYTPAGVEAWNNIRALDYLATRPEVDMKRVGVTGRSGGGAYSWVLAALDDRIAVSAPVAGITDLQNYVVDGKIEGHCDCMFHVNTYRWDYPLVAALTAPRPLLICNSDKDRIFPLDGVIRTHGKVRDIYQLYGKTKQFGLLITEGDHEDTQDLQLPVFRWFNRFLKKEESPIAMAAEKMFTPEELRVFQELPADAINGKIHESFVSTKSSSEKPADVEELKAQLRQKVFGGWPEETSMGSPRWLGSADRDGVRLACYEFESQKNVPLRLYHFRPHDASPKKTKMLVIDRVDWTNWLTSVVAAFPSVLREEIAASKIEGDLSAFKKLREELIETKTGLVVFAPRGVGLSDWSISEKKEAHIRRRFHLLGQTWEGMQVWDIIQAIRCSKNLVKHKADLVLQSRGTMAANSLYASLFITVQKLQLDGLPTSQDLEIPAAAPNFQNFLSTTDISGILDWAKGAGMID